MRTNDSGTMPGGSLRRLRRCFALGAASALAWTCVATPAASAVQGRTASAGGTLELGDAAVSASEHVGVRAGGAAAPLTDADATAVVADSLWAQGRDTGFAGQRVDESTQTINLYWKGRAPAQVQQYIATRPHGVTIRLTEGARHSRLEGMRAAERLADGPQAAALGIQSVAVKGDGSGVVARIAGRSPKRIDVDSATAIAGTAVEFVTRSTAVPTATRANDAPAWKGGARTVQNGMACSTGFAVLSGSSGRLLSANHCDAAADARVTDGNYDSIAPGGTSVSGKASIDSQLIDPSASPATTPRVYTGDWKSSSTATVKNWARNWEGQKVCTSGATSGQRCGYITEDATTWPYASGSFYVEASNYAVSVMTSEGDSGGPVFATTSGGVQARGIILGGYDPITCDVHADDVDPICLDIVVYAPISVVLNAWGVKLEVG